MPIYEYQCLECQDRFERFFKSFAEIETEETVCPNCGSPNIERLISNVSVVATGESGARPADSAANPAKSGSEDSKELAHIMKQAQGKAGGNLGDEFKEVAGRLDRGEKASSIEKSLRKRAGQDKPIH